MVGPLGNDMKGKDKKGWFLQRQAIGESKRILAEALGLLEYLKNRYSHESELCDLHNLVRIALEYLKTMEEPGEDEESVQFDLHQVIKRVLSLLDYQMRIRDINILYQPSTKQLLVEGDELNLVRTLLFLLMNIIKHYELTEAEREIIIETESTKGMHSVIIRDRLVSQDIDAHTRQMMRELIEDQGYEIEILQRHGQRVLRINMHSRKKTVEEGMDVLIVDDDPIICEFLKDLLVYLGHSPKVVNSPTEALRILKTFRFDLLFVDFIMPEMNGVTFLNEARKFCEISKFFFLTGDIHAPEIVEIKNREGVRVLEKPLSINIIKDVLREAGEPS